MAIGYLAASCQRKYIRQERQVPGLAAKNEGKMKSYELKSYEMNDDFVDATFIVKGFFSGSSAPKTETMDVNTFEARFGFTPKAKKPPKPK